MASVNDLVEMWRDDAQSCQKAGKADGNQYQIGVGAGMGDCSGELAIVSKRAWNPVSEPPTEADADAFGMVVVAGVNGRVTVDKWQAVQPYLLNEAACKWARIRDVVLLPLEE